jgi:hypothetical protein
MNRIAIRHQPPEHGWLTFYVTVDDRTIEIDASDVPNNPVQDLLDAIRLVAQGENARVWWHLEPGWYIFDFEHRGGTVLFRIATVVETVSGLHETEVASIETATPEMLLVFLRFLRRFQSENHSEPHWPEVDYRDISLIRDMIGSL